MPKEICRRLLVGAIAAGIAVYPLRAAAYKECQPYLGGQLCRAAIQSKHFQFVTAIQEKMNWCWAASLSMIFQWYGKLIDQKSIVNQTFGGPANLPADPFTLIRSINRTYVDDYGKPFSVTSTYYSSDFQRADISNRDIVASLAAERPMVYCNWSHMMVLIGVDYFDAANLTYPQIQRAWVADPMPGAPFAQDMGQGFRDLNQAELIPAPGGLLRFVAKVRVS